MSECKEEEARKLLFRVIEEDISPSEVRKGVEKLHPNIEAWRYADMTGWIIRYAREWKKHVANQKTRKERP